MYILRFAFPILWLIIVTILLTLPGSDFPNESWLDKIWIDKWVHIGLFSIMSFLFCWLIFKSSLPANKSKANFWKIGIAVLSYGVIMEFVQKYFVPLRSFDIGDIIADAAGSFLGVWYSIRRYIKK